LTKFYRFLSLASLASLALILGNCSPGSIADKNPNDPDGIQCSDISHCSAGMVCHQGQCAVLCAHDGDCSSGCCSEGLCLECGAPSANAPSISSLSGNGSIDTDPNHGKRHIRDRIVVEGADLADASAVLVAADGTSYALASCAEATDSRLELSLPEDLQAGAYTLTLTNQAGSCSGEMTLLQGEAGSLDASGAAIVATINDALELDPQLSVLGTMPTHQNMSVITAVGSADSQVTRQIFINGENQVDSADDGLFVAVLDLSTHTPYDGAIGVTLRTRMNIGADDQAGATHLHDILNGLGSDQVLVLASQGDITPLVQRIENSQGTPTRLREYGVSNAFFGLAAAEAYAMIGIDGIGEGNALEQVGTQDQGFAASVSTVAVGTGVVGLVTEGSTETMDARYINTNEADAISSSMLAPNSLLAGHISNGAVQGSHIQANTIDGSKVQSASLSLQHLDDSGCNVGDIPRWTGSAWGCASPCPAGMVDAGDYCIDADVNAAADWQAQANICQQEGKHMCSLAEWIGACNDRNNIGMNVDLSGGPLEYVDEYWVMYVPSYYSAYVSVGSTSCGRITHSSFACKNSSCNDTTDPGLSNASRCCRNKY